MGNKTGQISVIAALIGIIGVIIGVWLHQTGFFTSADIRFQRQPYADEVCPSSLKSYSGDFKIYFSNANGNRGTDLSVELQSPDNVLFIKNKDSVNLPTGNDVGLEFTIDTSSIKKNDYDVVDNATIKILAKYDMNSRGKISTLVYVCNYKKEGFLLTLVK